MSLEEHAVSRAAPENISDDRAALPASPPHAPVLWPSSARYCGVSRQNRIKGALVTLAIHVLILGTFFAHWEISRPNNAPQSLSVFDVTGPAAAPELPSAIPPGPEQVLKEQSRPEFDHPELEPPIVQLRSNNPIPLPAPVFEPGPPVKETTTPEARPMPPAPQPSNAKPTWEGAVLAALNKVKRYPREASFRRQQGEPWIRFVMNREGKVLSSRLERSSGVSSLDREAVALPKRAQPLPKPPAEVRGETIELVVPVQFFMR